jgi:hypothetical protein
MAGPERRHGYPRTMMAMQDLSADSGMSADIKYQQLGAARSSPPAKLGRMPNRAGTLRSSASVGHPGTQRKGIDLN